MAGSADSNRLQTINNSRVLRAIRLNPKISRIKVAELLALDRSTVTKIVQNLLDKDIVRTAGKNTVQTGVGRKQIELVVNNDLGVLVGIELQSGRYSFAVVSLAGEILDSFAAPISFDVNAGSLPSYLLSVIAEAKEAVARLNRRLLGIGVALPGIIDPYNGVVLYSAPLSIFEPFDLRGAISGECPDFLFFDNDANCCCWGELAFNPAERDRNFISVLGEFNRGGPPGQERAGGFAVGVGFAVRERVLHGDHFTAGEFRSFRADKTRSAQFSFSPEELARLPGDRDTLTAVYRELCESLAFLVTCLDFTKIVFTGDIPAHRENLRELLLEAVAERSLYDFSKEIRTDFSSAGDFSVALGAAGLFAEKLFSVPDVADFREELVGYSLFSRIV